MRIILFSKNTVTLLLLFTVFCINAATFDRTKSAILVEDANLDDKLKLRQVFAQIVVNNTGETISDVLNNSVFLEANIKSGLKRSYVEQIDNAYLSENSSYKYWFHAVMQEKFIDRVIADARFSVLPKNREKIMAWVTVTQDPDETKPEQKTNELTYAYDDELIIYWLNHWAKVMGINLVLPKMDEIDSINVSPQSIKSLSFESQKQAQSRYYVSHNLLLSIDKKADKVKARSGYARSNQDIVINHFQDLNGDIGSLMYSVFADLSFRFAQPFKIDSANIQIHTIQIVVNNLSSYDDVMHVQEYLKHLSVINDSMIVSATQNQLVLTSELTVTTASFLSMINRDKILFPVDQGSINQLVFSFNNL